MHANIKGGLLSGGESGERCGGEVKATEEGSERPTRAAMVIDMLEVNGLGRQELAPFRDEDDLVGGGEKGEKAKDEDAESEGVGGE